MNRYRARRARAVAVHLIAFHRTGMGSTLMPIPLRLLADPAWSNRHVVDPAIRHARRKAARRAS